MQRDVNTKVINQHKRNRPIYYPAKGDILARIFFSQHHKAFVQPEFHTATRRPLSHNSTATRPPRVCSILTQIETSHQLFKSPVVSSFRSAAWRHFALSEESVEPVTVNGRQGNRQQSNTLSPSWPWLTLTLLTSWPRFARCRGPVRFTCCRVHAGGQSVTSLPCSSYQKKP